MIVALAIVLAVMLVVMITACATVVRTGNGGWVDVFWTSGRGVAGMIAALTPWDSAPSWRQMLVASLVALWSLRLSSYIAIRVAGMGRSKGQAYRDYQQRVGAFIPRPPRA